MKAGFIIILVAIMALLIGLAIGVWNTPIMMLEMTAAGFAVYVPIAAWLDITLKVALDLAIAVALGALGWGIHQIATA